MVKTYRDRAIVLRSYKLGEADRILVMLGRKSGQIRAVAKGVRRTSSKFGARLGSFNMVDLQCYRGSSLDTVTQVETISAYSDRLVHDYSAFTNAKLIVEAAQKITEGSEEGSSEQFDLLHGAIHSLASRPYPPTLVATAYLLRALGFEGWSPSLSACVVCGRTEDLLYFSTSAGGAICNGCGPAGGAPISDNTLQLMDSLMLANWDETMRIPAEHWDEAHRLVGQWTQWHMEQKLRSLPFATTGSF